MIKQWMNERMPRIKKWMNACMEGWIKEWKDA